jgi:hypothetical protein
MKRVAVILIGLVLAGAAIWGLVAGGPYLRWYIRVRWHAREAARREPAAVEAWRKEFGDPAETLAALPTHDDNATALRLVELAPGTGVNLKTPESGALAKAIAAYVTAESMKTGGAVDPPPDAVRSYLDAHRAALDAVVDLLTHAEAPAWKTGEWPTTPDSTPVFGLRLLSSVLAAEALDQSSRGRDATADRALVAAWQLNASVREYPHEIEQLWAADITSTQASLARRVAIDLASWRVRLGEHDYHRSLMRALVVHTDRMRFSAPASPLIAFGRSLLFGQMERGAHADYLDLMRTHLVQLRDQSVTARPAGGNDVFDTNAMLRQGWSLGTTVALQWLPGLDRAWLGMDCVMLQLELTDRVLQARQQKARLGRWPAAIPDLETSRMAGVHWIYLVGQDGRMSISLDQPIQYTGPPLRFESGR